MSGGTSRLSWWRLLIGSALCCGVIVFSPLDDPPTAVASPSSASYAIAADGFTLPVFPIGVPGVHAYNARVVSALDHAGTFYSQCCDTTITAYTGETVVRGESTFSCPVAPVFPACFFAPNCICAYQDPAGDAFVINGNYTGSIFGPSYLLYDGHAGYDYDYGGGTALVATRSGLLCKPLVDEINGNGGAANPWDGFHAFYIDHGTFGETGYASWYLHASDLDGDDTSGEPLVGLEVGRCAPVETGQLVARVGNTGTFLPHLHFEVRVYAPFFGPENAPDIVDPYGWTGDGDDPWMPPSTNSQAVSRIVPVWVPEPAPAWLAASALAVLAGLHRRRYRPARLR